MRASSREEAEISGAAEVENHPCLSGFLLPNLPFTQSYHTFSGLKDDMSGSVKFIIRTEAIEK